MVQQKYFEICVLWHNSFLTLLRKRLILANMPNVLKKITAATSIRLRGICFYNNTHYSTTQDNRTDSSSGTFINKVSKLHFIKPCTLKYYKIKNITVPDGTEKVTIFQNLTMGNAVSVIYIVGVNLCRDWVPIWPRIKQLKNQSWIYFKIFKS